MNSLFQIKLVRSSPRSKDFQKSFKDAHQIYHKYQMEIHHDPPHKPNEGQYTRFLVDSPLEVITAVVCYYGIFPILIIDKTCKNSS